jgi:excisionase family DNA binding protein
VDLRDVNLLDVDQAAQRLGTETRFVRRLVAERRITYYKIGKYVRFHPDDLAEYVRQARREAINPILVVRDGVSAYA